MVLLLFTFAGLSSLAWTPFGKALAERLRARGAAGDAEGLAALEELSRLRERVAELEERLDFAERLLAKQRAAEPLGPGA